MERFNRQAFLDHGLPADYVQDNHSRSLPNTLRGLHFQAGPKAQGKLVGVVSGRIWDVAVDVRPKSPSFGQHFAVELSGENGQLLYIPEGFAHGFCVLGNEPADVFYKVTRPYHAPSDGGIYWADPELAVPWPVTDRSALLISEKDQKLPSFAEYRQAHQR